jgi:hypothetical protein
VVEGEYLICLLWDKRDQIDLDSILGLSAEGMTVRMSTRTKAGGRTCNVS